VLQVVLLDFAPDHAASYNALVEVIRRNLLLADWCDDVHNEVRRKYDYMPAPYDVQGFLDLHRALVRSRWVALHPHWPSVGL
jgi:hypothetical protein